MGDSKKSFKFGFKKKDKKSSKSQMFKSPSHYWNASQTDFLHSKGSANVELSIDPFNKSLIRVFCQSIDKMVNYKSIEYSCRTTVHQIIEKIIKILRLNKSIDLFVLVETIGRCLLIDKDGSTANVTAKSGQPSIYIEQNRRTLMNSDYILTVLNYWKPMMGFSRRFELCLLEKNHQMTSCDGDTNSSYLQYLDTHDSLSTISQKSNLDLEDKSTQTDKLIIPPVAPRRRLSIKTPKTPHLLTLKGDDLNDQDLIISLSSGLEFGSPGSNASITLKQLTDFPNEKICIITINNISDNNSTIENQYCFENICSIPDFIISINGNQVKNKVILQPGDIISIGDYYSYFFKDLSANLENRNTIIHFINSDIKKPNLIKVLENNGSDLSDLALTSSSVSNCSDINNSRTSSRVNKIRKKVSIDLHGISLQCFDTAFNQIIIHYFNGTMDLTNAVAFALYLIRFCRESARCSFSLEEMQERIKSRFCKSLKMAQSNDYYLLGNLKLTAFTFQLWLVYNNENYIETNEENRHWLDFLEMFTLESFDHLSCYICETSQNLSACFFEENPFVNFDEQQRFREDGDINTIEKFLSFLTDIYKNISNIGCDKMSDILKSVFTSRIVTYITESTVIQVLSDMKNFNWNKGIQISTQVEKFEEWLKMESVFNIFETDGFLQDFSRLISTRAVMLQKMDWKTIRKTHSKIPLSVLSQFLSGLASDNMRILAAWQPTPYEINEANKEVMDILSQYLRKADTFTLFQPGIILQTDCVPIDKSIQSTDFIAHCTVLDTELIAMGETFQWMSLPKPQSLVNFKNGRWVGLRQSIGENLKESYAPNIKNKLNLDLDKVSNGRKLQTDSDYSSLSNKADTITPSKKLIARYLMLKNNFSKSLVSINEPDIPKPPRRKKNKGSFSNLSQTNNNTPVTHYYQSANGNKTRESFGNKSCFSRIGRSDSTVSDLSNHVIMDIDTDNSSCIIDVDQSIEDMEREIQNSLSLNKFLDNRRLSPYTGNGFEYDDDDDMSIGLSAAGMSNRLRAHSKSSDALVDIDDRKQLEVVLTKSTDESYGITLADGTQTNLKCEGIFIYKITRSSPAFKNGKMKPGDRIIAINSYTVDELSFQECLLLITKSSTSVKLLIEKSDLKTTLGIMSIYQ